jgi:glutaredoxin-like YruB-family protein
MKTHAISSATDLNLANSEDSSFVLFYKSGHAASTCAIENAMASAVSDSFTLFLVDVSKVRDIHPEFGVTSVPSLIEIKNKQAVKTIKGCQSSAFYTTLFKHIQPSAFPTDKPKQKQVIVYSTPTCSWCRTIKDYFKQHQITYRDIDVSKDTKAAEEMVKRSGQQGVPQTSINGQMVIGFDKQKIDQLLNIN